MLDIKKTHWYLYSLFYFQIYFHVICWFACFSRFFVLLIFFSVLKIQLELHKQHSAISINCYHFSYYHNQVSLSYFLSLSMSFCFTSISVIYVFYYKNKLSLIFSLSPTLNFSLIVLLLIIFGGAKKKRDFFQLISLFLNLWYGSF